jgi:hypothetical protein
MSPGEEVSSHVQLKGLVTMNLERLQIAQLSHHTAGLREAPDEKLPERPELVSNDMGV